MRPISTRKKLLFAALAVTIALVGLELLARAYFYARELRAGASAGPDAVIHRFHPLRYELRPGATIPANGAVAHINDVGLRGPDVETPKRRVRVYCAGDSCTFGYAPDVGDEATYPAALGRVLEKSTPGRFEVLNAGLPSFGTLDALDYFVYRGRELRPDVVVIMVGWNDSHLCHDLDSPPRSRLREWAQASALVRLGTQLATRAGLAGRIDLARERSNLKRMPRPTDHLSDATFARCAGLLRAFVGACRDAGASPVLVTLPNFARPGWGDVDSLSDNELRRMLPHLVGGNLSPAGWLTFIGRTNAAIEAAARDLDVPLVDGAAIRDRALFVDLCHLNAAGNAALAEKVAEEVAGLGPAGDAPRSP